MKPPPGLVKSPHTLFFSFAHPDDESFSGVGTAMKYADSGAKTVLVTATRGERGKAGDPPICRPEQLGACREAELRAVAGIVRFDALHLLDYRDRELSEAAPDEIRRTLVGLIRQHRPSVVLTFDPNGFNVHPDHVAISRFTSEAIAAAADPRWLPDTGAAHVVGRLVWTPPFPPWEQVGFERIGDHAAADFVIDVSAWHDRRVAALRAHRTQHLSIDRNFFHKPNLKEILAMETWRQAWGPPLARRPSDDILEGL
jgi:LmbE family N-acetylglucosaminyl deacetylase